MCSPAFMIASAVLSAYSAYSQAKSQADAAEYSAKVNEQNAKNMEVYARDAENRGANDAATMRENYKKANAAVRAKAGSSGLLADTGSFENIQDQNVVTGEMNVLTARNNAAREAWGYRVKGTDYTNQAKADRFSASNSRTNGLLTAGATLVSGVSRAAGQFGGGSTGSFMGSSKASTDSEWNDFLSRN